MQTEKVKTDQELLAKAILLASQMHFGQYDKGGNPYILHCLKVMHYVKSDCLKVQQVAVLHDIIEDTDITYQDLLDRGFTTDVVYSIKLLTKQRGQSAKEYLDGILSDRVAMLVKMADLRHNSDIRRLKGVTEKDILRIQKYHNMYVTIKEVLYGSSI